MIITDRTKGLLLMFAAVAVLSPDALLVQLIDCDIWTLLFWRCLLTGTMMTGFLAVVYRHRLASCFYAVGRRGLLSALTVTVGSMFFVASLKQTAAANALVILAATPIISSLLAWLFLREKPPLRTQLAIVACFGGMVLIFSGSLAGGLLLGDLMALAATFMWGANIVVIRSGKEINMIPANILGNFGVVPLAWLAGAAPTTVALGDAGLLLLLGGVLLPTAFALITLGPRFLNAAEVSLILLLETILGPLWVWLVIAEAPPHRTLVAGIVIVGTLALHTLAARRGPVVSRTAEKQTG